MEDDRQKWLDNLKIDDEICYDSGMNCKRFIIAKISKITPTRRFNLSNGSKFDNEGYCRISPWQTIHIEEVTTEIKIGIKRRKLINNFQAYDFNRLTYNKLVEIDQIINR